MKIELKRITYNSRLSQETNAFAADLYVDGKKIGEISNAGHGGPDDFHGDRAAYDRADAWVKANVPSTEFHGITIEPSLEIYCDDLLQAWIIERDVKRAMAKAALYTHPGKVGVWTMKYTGKKAPDEALFKHIAAKHPGATILNTLPIAEAVAAYRAASL